MITSKYGGPWSDLGWLAVLTLLAVEACSATQPVATSPVADASTAPTVMPTPIPDAGLPPSRLLSGAAAPVQGTRGMEMEVFASATSHLAPFGTSADASVAPADGMATWRTTPIGVDLEVTISGCLSTGPQPLEILEASDCSPSSLQASIWGHGSGIPGMLCTGASSGHGTLNYSRSPEQDRSWTIGGPALSNIVGHAVVLRDPKTLAPRACGVIERGPDVVRSALPAATEAPRIEARAALVGLCLSRQFTHASAGCPDAEAMLECAAVHCDVGSCLQVCQDYTRCLDQASDVCLAMTSCTPTPECGLCQSQLASCSLGFCSEHSFCAPPLTADGPCSKLEGCCLLQGTGAANCLTTLQTIVTAGGDVNCRSSMHDWDVLSHLHVPCRFEE